MNASGSQWKGMSVTCIVFGRIGYGDDVKICPYDEDDRPYHLIPFSSQFEKAGHEMEGSSL